MWKWIAEQRRRDGSLPVNLLRLEWMEEHFLNGYILSDCFFCHYAAQFGGLCDHCPGKLVSKRFDCGITSYNYNNKPIKFYKKIVELNEKRKKQNESRKHKR